jgi:hypothetical protein
LQLPSGQSYRAFFSGQGTPESPYALNVFAFSTPNMANGDSLTLDFFNGAGCFSELTIQSDTLNQSTLFEAIEYRELSPFISVSAQQDEWIARTSGDSLTTWSLPEAIDSYIGEHITLISHASADCSEFSGWLLTETGGALMQLQTLFIPPPPVYAGIQCIHASADTSMETLSLFINDSLYIPSFNFRTASDIIRVLVNDSLRLALLPAGSSSLQNPIFTQTLYLNANENYRLVLAGVNSVDGYNPAPDLRWVVLPAMNAPASGSCALQFIHAATDAGTIRMEENTTPIVPFFNETSFGEFSYTNSLAADQDYALGLLNSEVNFLYGVYALPINSWSWGDSSITLLTSGFRQPLNNSNGSNFAVHAITTHGNVIPLSDYVSTAENSEDILLSYYPNPTSDFLNIALHARENAVIKLELSNTLGQIVHQQSMIIGNYAQRICLETSSFPSGLYSLTIVAEEQSGPIFLSRTVVIEH